MWTKSVLVALAIAPAALAHTAFTGLYVDGTASGDGVAMRMRNDPATATFPLNDLSSNDLACNVNGDKGVPRVQSVRDGATLTFEFRSWPDDATKERYDRGHEGPCAVYLKKVDSAIDDPGHGDGWFKIVEDGYDASSKQWCSDKLIDNNGLFSVALPKGLQGGYYLARPELLALHAANVGDPQFYAGCAQIFLESSGDLVPESTVSIPGYVKAGQPSVSFDIYNRDNAEYTMPGPSVAKLISDSSFAGGSESGFGASQTEGARPAGCIAENANWCGKEVSSYSTESGCWASAEECWDQSDVCFNSAPPTGSKGCVAWQSKCKGIQSACEAGNFNGPPNKGKDITPKHETIDVGVVMKATAGVDVSEAPKVEAPKVEAPKAKAPVKEELKGDINAEPKPTPKQVAQPAPTANKPDILPAASPKPTPTVPAPKQPETGVVCPEGFVCVTSYATVTETEVVYATVFAQPPKRWSVFERRAAWRA